MDAEQIQELCYLQDKIITKLRHHAYIKEESARHVFQYLILPSFTPPIAWDVFSRIRRGHSNEFILLRTSWRSDLDAEKMRNPTERLRHEYPFIPTIELHLLPVPSVELEQLAKDLKQISLPIGAQPNVFGIDGTSFEIAIEQPPLYMVLTAKCRLSWWHETPPEWKPLQEWVTRAEDVFESAWSIQSNTAVSVPYVITAIDDTASRHKARLLFHEGKYLQAAELFAEVATRESLSTVETKMLEMAVKRAGNQPEG